jgi:hypothetical protein
MNNSGKMQLWKQWAVIDSVWRQLSNYGVYIVCTYTRENEISNSSRAPRETSKSYLFVE